MASRELSVSVLDLPRFKEAIESAAAEIENANETIAVLELRVQKLRDALFDVTRTVIDETAAYRHGKPAYDMTLDHLHDVAVVARQVLYDD